MSQHTHPTGKSTDLGMGGYYSLGFDYRGLRMGCLHVEAGHILYSWPVNPHHMNVNKPATPAMLSNSHPLSVIAQRRDEIRVQGVK